jgi:hypothetical protein
LFRKFKPLHPNLNGKLVWYQPRQVLKIFELRSLNEYHATLLINRQRYSTRPETTATAVTATEGWSFRHTNELLPNITVSNLGSLLPIGTFIFWNYNQGMLWLTNESRYYWVRNNHDCLWSYLNSQQDILLFHEIEIASKKGAEVSIPAESWDLPDLMVLTLLGGFLMMHMVEVRQANPGSVPG